MKTLLLLLCLVTAIIVIARYLRSLLPAERATLQQRVGRVAAWLRANVQELVGIPVALVLYWVSGWLIRWFEPTSALYDSGVLQGIAVAFVHLIAGNSIARFGVRMNISWYDPAPVSLNPANRETKRQWLFATYLLAYCLLAAFI